MDTDTTGSMVCATMMQLDVRNAGIVTGTCCNKHHDSDDTSAAIPSHGASSTTPSTSRIVRRMMTDRKILKRVDLDDVCRQK